MHIGRLLEQKWTRCLFCPLSSCRVTNLHSGRPHMENQFLLHSCKPGFIFVNTSFLSEPNQALVLSQGANCCPTFTSGSDPLFLFSTVSQALHHWGSRGAILCPNLTLRQVREARKKKAVVYFEAYQLSQ